jgi:hypothetical protein
VTTGDTCLFTAMSNINVNLNLTTQEDLRCTLLQTSRGINFSGQGQSGTISGSFTNLTSAQSQIRSIILPDASGTVLINPSTVTVPIILNSNVVVLGNTTAGSIVEELSPIYTYTSSVATLTSGVPAISAADYLGRIIVYAGSTSINSPIDTATNFIAALSAAGGTPYVGQTMNCKLVNAGTGGITLQQATDASITLVGTATVGAGTNAELVLRITSVTVGSLAGVLYT